MKSTGIVRKIDELGRIVIPMEIRRNLGLEEKDPIEIFVDGDSIILKSYQAQEGPVQKVKTLLGKFSEEDILEALNKLEQKK